MYTIGDLVRLSGLTQTEIGNKLGWSKSQTSRIASGDYPNSDAKTMEAYRYLSANGYLPEDSAYSPDPSAEPIVIDKEAVVHTENYIATHNLCDDLLSPESLLSASIGMVLGKAGFGKTTTVKRYAVENDDAVYILYRGDSKAALFRRISESLVGRYAYTYDANVRLIEEATLACRKLIIIDEADRIPLRLLEDLRTLNEDGAVPLLLVGEPMLSSLTRKADRIESRIRKPVITFKPLDAVILTAYYKKVANLDLSPDIAKKLVSVCNRDFRVAANDLQHIVNIMNANGMSEVTMEVINESQRR